MAREQFDIFRDRKPHIGFGHGAHVCLGMHLARLESTMIFNTLFDRLPGLRLDPDAPAPYVSGTFFRSPQHLRGGLGLIERSARYRRAGPVSARPSAACSRQMTVLGSGLSDVRS